MFYLSLFPYYNYNKPRPSIMLQRHNYINFLLSLFHLSASISSEMLFSFEEEDVFHSLIKSWLNQRRLISLQSMVSLPSSLPCFSSLYFTCKFEFYYSLALPWCCSYALIRIHTHPYSVSGIFKIFGLLCFSFQFYFISFLLHWHSQHLRNINAFLLLCTRTCAKRQQKSKRINWISAKVEVDRIGIE